MAILRSCLERIPLTLKRKRHGSLTPRLGKSLASRRLKPFRFNQNGTRIAQDTLSQANMRCRSAESINLIVANLPVLRLLLQYEHNPLQHRLLGIEVFHFVCNIARLIISGME